MWCASAWHLPPHAVGQPFVPSQHKSGRVLLLIFSNLNRSGRKEGGFWATSLYFLLSHCFLPPSSLILIPLLPCSCLLPTFSPPFSSFFSSTIAPFSLSFLIFIASYLPLPCRLAISDHPKLTVSIQNRPRLYVFPCHCSVAPPPQPPKPAIAPPKTSLRIISIKGKKKKKKKQRESKSLGMKASRP